MTGCSADRSAEADRLRPMVQALPGVTSANVNYVNDFENGANLEISLNMTHASIVEIREAVVSIVEAEGSRFDDHRLETAIAVADRSTVEYGGYGKHLDAEEVAADATAIRALESRVSAETIEWHHFDDHASLELWESNDSDADLQALVETVVSPSSHVYVRPNARQPQNAWDVDLPLTLEQVATAAALRDRLAMPVYQVDMRDGHISGLDVNLGDIAVANEKARAVVAAVAPTQSRPLTVTWRLIGDKPRENGRFAACSPTGGLPTAPPARDVASLEGLFAQRFPGCPG